MESLAYIATTDDILSSKFFFQHLYTHNLSCFSVNHVFLLTLIGFMEIVCVLQAHGEFLVSLCLVVVICHDSFKKVIVVVKVPGCGT